MHDFESSFMAYRIHTVSPQQSTMNNQQLESQALITPIRKAKKLSAGQTYDSLHNFLSTLPLSPARTQLERLADSLGVEAGLIAPSESSRRETRRRDDRAAAKLERRRRRAEAQQALENEGMDGIVDALGTGAVGEKGGAPAANGEEQGDDEMGRSDGGDEEREDDIEYGDVVDEDQADEPDRRMDEDEEGGDDSEEYDENE